MWNYFFDYLTAKYYLPEKDIYHFTFMFPFFNQT